MKSSAAMRQIVFRAGIVICLIAFIVNVIIYYFIKSEYQDLQEQDIHTTTEIMRQAVSSTQGATDNIEHGIDQRLNTISKAISIELEGQSIDQITDEELVILRDKWELSGVSLFIKTKDDIVVAKSSEKEELHLGSKNWGYWYTAFEQLMALQTVTVGKGYTRPNYWAGPISNANWDQHKYFKYAYYYDGKTPFMVNAYIADQNIYNLTFRSGPSQLIDRITKESKDVQEIGVINVPAWLKGKDPVINEPNTDLPILYGKNSYTLEQDATEFTKVLSQQQTHMVDFEKDGQQLKKYYIPLINNRVLTIVYSLERQQRAEMRILTTFLVTIFALCLSVFFIIKRIGKRQQLLLKTEEERLRIAEEFKSTIQMLPNIIFKCKERDDGEFIFTYNEGTTSEELGSTTELVKGKTFQEVYPQLEYTKEYLERVFAGETVEFLIELDKRVYKTIVKPVWDDGGQTISEVAGFATDITDRIRLEKELEEARDSALRLTLAKSEFLAMMSHEIRTPLHSIIGSVDNMLDTPLTDKQKRYIQIAQTSGDMLLHLINDILDLSKLEATAIDLEKNDFNLSLLVEVTIQILSTRAKEKGITLACSIDPDLSMNVIGDPERVRQILFNLVGNAIKFTVKGHVILRVEKDPQSSDEVRFLFSVEDTGIGIAEEHLHSIFANFSQADSSISRKFGGTGLGLGISKRLVELMGGQIWVHSEQGKGSTFFFTIQLDPQLPQTLEFDVAARTERDEWLSGNLPPLKILLVDDSQDNLFLMQAFLEKAPFQIETVKNGQIAYERVQSEAFDIVLMDVQMPIMDGYTATRLIRKWEQEQRLLATPIIALTANALPEHIAKSKEVGCTGHITKPIKRETLLQVILEFAVQDRINESRYL